MSDPQQALHRAMVRIQNETAFQCDDEGGVDWPAWAVEVMDDLANANAALEQKAGAAGWFCLSERLPPEGKQVIIKTKYGIDVDEWIEYREAPSSCSTKTVCVGHGLSEHEIEDVIAWMDPDTAPPSTAEAQARALENMAETFRKEHERGKGFTHGTVFSVAAGMCELEAKRIREEG